MLTMSEYKHIPSAPKPVDALFSVSRLNTVEHLVDGCSREFIRVSDGISYPDDSSGLLQEVLLRKNVSGDTQKREYMLPDNYATFGQALNDAIGIRGNKNTLEIGYELFYELGETISRIAETDGVVPKSLSYNDVIFLTDTMGLKLLPPLEVTHAETEIKNQLADSLYRSCTDAVATKTQQRQLDDIFVGFSEWFKGERHK